MFLEHQAHYLIFRAFRVFRGKNYLIFRAFRVFRGKNYLVFRAFRGK